MSKVDLSYSSNLFVMTKSNTTFQLLKINCLHILLGLVVFTFITSCKTYYKAKTVHIENDGKLSSTIDSLKAAKRTFILRNGENAFLMANLELSKNQKTINAVLEELPETHKLHLKNGLKGKFQYDNEDRKNAPILNEVHFYVLEDSRIEFGNYTLDMEMLKKIEVLVHDKARTSESYFYGIAGGLLTTVVLAAIIVAALKSSCPFVSAFDGENFSLQGEIFGGAIYPQLSRKDYLPLKMAPMPDGSFQIKISNELKEEQFTDFVRLWKINHETGTKIYVDEFGNLMSVQNPKAPVEALLNGNDVLTDILKPDDLKMTCMNDSSRPDGRNILVLRFQKPIEAEKGKLVLKIKNSYWLDLLYGELIKGLGTYYAAYKNEQKKKSAEELKKWVHEQMIPLEIAIHTNKGIKKISSLSTVGPLAFRETAIEIDLSDITSNEVYLILSSGFMFWEIDYVAMDYNADKHFSVEKLEPQSAFDETGKDILSLIINDDGLYLSQPQIGNVASIAFKNPSTSNNNMLHSYILETKGYYEHIRDFKGKPDFKFLKQFQNPGGFNLFSLNYYKKFSQESLASMPQKN
jgi:hypothetical protein